MEATEAPDWLNPLRFEGTLQPGETAAADPTVLRFASLNCLASDYVNFSQYHWVPREYLTWEHRRHSLFAAIAKVNPAVLCLQECDHISEWRELLGCAGYDIAVALRPNRKEGCLTAWKRDLLEPSAPSSVVNFNCLVDLHQGDLRYHRDNIALICPLRELRQFRSGLARSLVVANTHLYWNPLKPEVKIAQAAMLAHRLHGLLADADLDAYLLLGDLNSLPGSEVVRFLERGSVTLQSLPRCNRFLCDTSMNRLCRWLRVLGLDTALESPGEQLRRTRHNDCGPLFERARAERRVLVTSSVRVIQRTDCPPAVQVDNRNLHQSLLKLCRRLDVPVNPEHFLTVCIKCNGRIRAENDWGDREQDYISELRQKQPLTFDGMDSNAIKIKIAALRTQKRHECGPADISLKPLAADVYFPDDLPLFMCTNPECHQIYWFSEGIKSGAVRSKALADQLYDFIQKGFSAEESDLESSPQTIALSGVGPSLCDTHVASSAYRAKLIARGVASVEVHAAPPPPPPQYSARSETVEHSLRLQSPYASSPVSIMLDGSDDSKSCAGPISTVRDQFHGLIDHIFFSPQHLKCVRRLALPSIGEIQHAHKALGPGGSLPCKSWGSDHLVVACDLAWR